MNPFSIALTRTFKTASLALLFLLCATGATWAARPVKILGVETGLDVTLLAGTNGRSAYLVISSNGSNAPIVLDATSSYDPDNDPLYFFWLEADRVYPHPSYIYAFSYSARTTNLFDLGIHYLDVHVSDTRKPKVDFEEDLRFIDFWVLTPIQALEWMADILADESLPGKNRRNLIHKLSEAGEALERGRTKQAIHHLEELLKTSRVQKVFSDEATRENFQQIIETLIDSLNL